MTPKAEVIDMEKIISNLSNISTIWPQVDPRVELFAKEVAANMAKMHSFRKITDGENASLIQPMDFVSHLDLTMKRLKSGETKNKGGIEIGDPYKPIRKSLLRLTIKSIPRGNGKMRTLKFLRTMRKIQHGPYLN